MACGRCGVNQSLVELITRNQIFTLLEEGTLQAGLVDCNNNPLGKGTRMVTCDGLAEAICNLIESGDVVLPVIDVITLGEDNVLTIAMTNGDMFQIDLSRYKQKTGLREVKYNANNHTLSIEDSTGAVHQVEITPDLLVELDALSPQVTSETDLPTTMYGGRDRILGDPAGWMEVVVGGREVLVPYFEKR